MDEYDLFRQRMAALSGAIFLFGLAALFWSGWVWPGILLVIWLTAVPVLLAEKGWRYGLWLLAQLAIWLGGFPLLMARPQLLVPGLLVLAGISMLLVAIAPPDRLDARHAAWVRERRQCSRAKRKRERSLPPVEERLAETLGYDLDAAHTEPDDLPLPDDEADDQPHDGLHGRA